MKKRVIKLMGGNGQRMKTSSCLFKEFFFNLKSLRKKKFVASTQKYFVLVRFKNSRNNFLNHGEIIEIPEFSYLNL